MKISAQNQLSRPAAAILGGSAAANGKKELQSLKKQIESGDLKAAKETLTKMKQSTTGVDRNDSFRPDVDGDSASDPLASVTKALETGSTKEAKAALDALLAKIAEKSGNSSVSLTASNKNASMWPGVRLSISA